MKFLNACFLALVALVWLPGCQRIPKSDPDFSPVAPANLRPPPQNTGSIYQAGYDMRLFEDHTAKRVGDVLTVRLTEKTAARKDADTNLQRDTSTEIKAPMILGQDGVKLLGFDLSESLKSNHSFEGKGSSDQNNSLQGDISVTVVEVLPNGSLKVRGEKRVTLNRGDEFIRLSGIVRPVDIDASNVIPSTKVADATIMYTGEGELADANRMGWLSRLFMSVLFPF